MQEGCKVSSVQPCLDVCHVDARSIGCAARSRIARMLRSARLVITTRLCSLLLHTDQGAAMDARLTGPIAHYTLTILMLKAACITTQAWSIILRVSPLKLPPSPAGATTCRCRRPL